MSAGTTKPLFFFLALATWIAVLLLGVGLIALGQVIVGALIVLASIPAAALVAIAGEPPVAAELPASRRTDEASLHDDVGVSAVPIVRP